MYEYGSIIWWSAILGVGSHLPVLMAWGGTILPPPPPTLIAAPALLLDLCDPLHDPRMKSAESS